MTELGNMIPSSLCLNNRVEDEYMSPRCIQDFLLFCFIWPSSCASQMPRSSRRSSFSFYNCVSMGLETNWQCTSWSLSLISLTFSCQGGGKNWFHPNLGCLLDRFQLHYKQFSSCLNFCCSNSRYPQYFSNQRVSRQRCSHWSVQLRKREIFH